jgi:hypothetical protein
MVSSKFDRGFIIIMVLLRHEHLYGRIRENMIVSDRLPKPGALQKTLQGSQVILCTLSMISNPRLQVVGLTQMVPIINVIIDEASQIEVGQYVPLFNSYGKTLRKICFVGDDKQCKSLFPTALPEIQLLLVPPHGQDDLQNLQSIFEVDHLRETFTFEFLDTQCAYPISTRRASLAYLALSRSHAPADRGLHISTCIQRRSSILLGPRRPLDRPRLPVYRCERVRTAGQRRKELIRECSACFLRARVARARDANRAFRCNLQNQKEVDAIVLLARHLQEENKSFRIITPYDAQRSALEQALQDEDLKWEDKCFNVDSFQGPCCIPTQRARGALSESLI